MTQLLHTGSAGPSLLDREDYAMMALDFWGRHAPRRSRSQIVDHCQPAHLPEAPPSPLGSPGRPAERKEPSEKGKRSAAAAVAAVMATARSEIDERRVGRPLRPVAKDTSVIRRPPLPPPRRSYSVMQHEPIPHYHRSSAHMTLMDLPAEIHYSIFDFLDPIDSTCLGLTNSHLYSIHRRMHGVVPLSASRIGPNELEWAWWVANRASASGTLAFSPAAPIFTRTDSPPCHASSTTAAAASPPTSPCPHFAVPADTAAAAAPSQTTATTSDATPVSFSPAEGETSLSSSSSSSQPLAKLRVPGQAYCRKCVTSRCELYKHIQEWMGTGAEYCSVKQKFGPAAPDDAKPYCYMGKPGDPSRCGRHRVWKFKAVLRP